MQKCWALDPDQRPTPEDIVANLTPLNGSISTETVEKDSKSNDVKANGTQHTKTVDEEDSKSDGVKANGTQHTETIEDDCKSNGVKANGNHYSGKDR